jgi:SagB-type dehydrogenase family enzyme
MRNESVVDRVLKSFERVRAQFERERIAQFAPFGVDPTCHWPASRVYHQQSALGPAWTSTLTVDQVEKMTLDLKYKSYPGAPRTLLPREETIARRKSCRTFAHTPVSLELLAKLLELSCGVTDKGFQVPRRAAPSGGGLYPVEMYAIVFSVSALSPGIYHYVPMDHALELVRTIPGREVLAEIIPPQAHSGGAPVVLCLSGIFDRTQLKYTERGYRFILLEAGHILQNASLATTALGLGAVCIGGFWDENLNALMGFDWNTEAAVYSMLVGHPG